MAIIWALVQVFVIAFYYDLPTNVEPNEDYMQSDSWESGPVLEKTRNGNTSIQEHGVVRIKKQRKKSLAQTVSLWKGKPRFMYSWKNVQ